MSNARPYERLPYFQNCVNWPHAADTLLDMIDGSAEVTRTTFTKHVNKAHLRGLEAALGYRVTPARKGHRHGLSMAEDWHVTYHKGPLFGGVVYFFRFSSIEYVFAAI